jgi:hypothetical protein
MTPAVVRPSVTQLAILGSLASLVIMLACRTAQPAATPPAEPEPVRPPAFTAQLQELDQRVRTACTAELSILLQNPIADLTFDDPPRQIQAGWPGSIDLVSFYFGNYAVDIPRTLFARLGNPMLFRNGVSMFLDGHCSLHIRVEQPLGLPQQLRELAGRFDIVADGIAKPSDHANTYSAWFRLQLIPHLSFNSEYDVVRKMYTTRFSDLGATKPTTPALYAAAALLGMKVIATPDGVEHGRHLVQTPHFPGFAWGLPEQERHWIHLHRANQIIKITTACLPRFQADSTPLDRYRNAIVASIRPHGSTRPGTRLLEQARSELARPDERRNLELARALVLCAARYDDAYSEAVKLGRELVSPELHYFARYMHVLNREGESR